MIILIQSSERFITNLVKIEASLHFAINAYIRLPKNDRLKMKLKGYYTHYQKKSQIFFITS